MSLISSSKTACKVKIHKRKIHFHYFPCYYFCFQTSKISLQTQEVHLNPYPTAFPYGNSMVLHFYQQQESSTTKTVHKVINKGLKTYV